MAFVVAAWFALHATSTHAGPLVTETDRKTFDEVVEDLDFAIGEQNFRIVGRNDIGQGIRARGKPGFPRAIVLQFCNLTLAQEALEIDPGMITHMPCRIAVYEHGGRVFVTTTLLPEESTDPRLAAFARKVNRLLREMIQYAAH